MVTHHEKLTHYRRKLNNLDEETFNDYKKIMKTMTMRQRMLSVLQGQRPDRVPFVQYHRLAAPNEDIWQTRKQYMKKRRKS